MFDQSVLMQQIMIQETIRQQENMRNLQRMLDSETGRMTPLSSQKKQKVSGNVRRKISIRTNWAYGTIKYPICNV